MTKQEAIYLLEIFPDARLMKYGELYYLQHMAPPGAEEVDFAVEFPTEEKENSSINSLTKNK